MLFRQPAKHGRYIVLNKDFKYAASHNFIHIKHTCISHTQVFNSLTEISFDVITKEAKESLPGKSEVNALIK